MAQGDVDAQIVTSPITAASVKTAVDAALAATNLSGSVSLTGFNQGRSILVVAVENR